MVAAGIEIAAGRTVRRSFPNTIRVPTLLRKMLPGC